MNQKGTVDATKKDFLARLQFKVTEQDLRRINFAYDLAEYGHQGQWRDNGEPFFTHCLATADILTDELGIYDADMIITALLHDILEDSRILTTERIAWIFGEQAAAWVTAITKPGKEDERFALASRHYCKQSRLIFYFEQVKKAPIRAQIIKLCDCLHNLRTLQHCSPEKRERKIQETQKYIMPLVFGLNRATPFADFFFANNFDDFFRREMDKALDNLKQKTE